jgi:hypothetical protein
MRSMFGRSGGYCDRPSPTRGRTRRRRRLYQQQGPKTKSSTNANSRSVNRGTHHTPTVLSVPNLRLSLPTTPRRSSAPSHSQTRQLNRFTSMSHTPPQAHRKATKRDKGLRGCIHQWQKTGWRHLVVSGVHIVCGQSETMSVRYKWLLVTVGDVVFHGHAD